MTASCSTSVSKAPSIKLISPASSQYSDILSEFPELTRPPGLPREVKHSTLHYIQTTDLPPVVSRPRRMRPELLKVAKAEFDDMIREGTARPSNSPWSSPLHLAPKKKSATSKPSKRTRIQGPVRPCGDYRRVNARTIPDKYPVRHIADYSNDLSGCSIFSVIDLVKAFQQIPVNPADISKTAIVTPFGLFEFPYMSFGLRNAAQTFQRFIDELLRGLDFCFAYIDDILCSRAHLRNTKNTFAPCSRGSPSMAWLSIKPSASSAKLK